MPVKIFDAATADAGAVTQFLRHAGHECGRNLHAGAPARTFVGGGRAKLALVRAAAQRTQADVVRAHASDRLRSFFRYTERRERQKK